ncbi:type II and III secretion system protein family protein [Pseudothauera nasutitermitis]|uniref:Type II and III secretion system protein family protein n=1 Tax=Pseudothauera nasutitermitis TaxID=2565930 RepID=A0A4S4B3L7_9RHOO|nr:type II and III secretion system protein family protein [Pseudothauera nasutitermitis]THF67252.1 type II and III secretion system protein family protein [Pseudothauera nasutitermitis]
MKHRPSLLALIVALGCLSGIATPACAAADAQGAAVEVLSSPSTLPPSLRQIGETSQMTLRVREGNLLQLPRAAAKVLVADPRVASFQVPSPTSLFVFAERVGSTTLYALDAQDAVIAAVRIVAEHNLDALRAQISRSVPDVRVELEPALNNRIIVRGTVRTPIEARQVVDQVQAYLDANASSGAGQGGGGGQQSGVVNQLKVELSSQINIQVRVVEVSRSLSHDLGFNWSTVLNPKHGLFGADGSIQIATGGSTVFDASGVTGGVMLGGSFVPRNGRIGSLSMLLTAMQSEGMATVLAEPNLTAMSGESAAFAAGGEVPVVIITNNNVQIDYKSYGVILRMTPTLLSANRISLHIAPEVSELTDEGSVTLTGGSTIPAFKVRRADTTVELASGQSFALAGMLRSNSSQQVTGVPGLSSIPWLGRLFENESTASQETELVILVTANVVDPVSAADLQVPGRALATIDSLVPREATAGYLY